MAVTQQQNKTADGYKRACDDVRIHNWERFMQQMRLQCLHIATRVYNPATSDPQHKDLLVIADTYFKWVMGDACEDGYTY